LPGGGHDQFTAQGIGQGLGDPEIHETTHEFPRTRKVDHPIVLRAPGELLRLGPDGRFVGRAEVESAGGRVVRVPLVSGRSTSTLVDRIRRS